MKDLRLENFRCYQHLEVNFKPGVNLLIGDNASGKTSLILACKYVLSSFFAGFSDENTKWVGPVANDFSVYAENGIIAPEQPIILSFSYDSDIFPLLSGGSNVNKIQYLQKSTKKNSRCQTKGLSEFKAYSKELQTQYVIKTSAGIQHTHPLPLFASFSTEDIHSNSKISREKFKSYNQKRSFGYYECLESNGLLNHWLKRLLVLEEAHRNNIELSVVKAAVNAALGPDGCNIISDIEVRPNQSRVYVIFTDGRECDVTLLSDGYRRLVNIVIDIALRAALLNGAYYGDETLVRTRGTVLIDEIDMHLHPSLQSCIVKGLTNAFPNIQFILTTHAPMVMASVQSNDNNAVYYLKYSGNSYELSTVNVYGYDISQLTELYLGVPPRPEFIHNVFQELIDMIDNEQFAEAKIRLSDLKHQYGPDFPDLVKAQALLDFYNVG